MAPVILFFSETVRAGLPRDAWERLHDAIERRDPIIAG
jgi:hypothetical protein